MKRMDFVFLLFVFELCLNVGITNQNRLDDDIDDDDYDEFDHRSEESCRHKRKQEPDIYNLLNRRRRQNHHRPEYVSEIYNLPNKKGHHNHPRHDYDSDYEGDNDDRRNKIEYDDDDDPDFDATGDSMEDRLDDDVQDLFHALAPEKDPDLPFLCTLPRDAGTCREINPRYYYDVKKKQCMTFNYGGCDGNENLFETYQGCNDICGTKKEATSVSAKDENCLLHVDKGFGGEHYIRYYFDSHTNKCKTFVYRGSLGNPNRFKTAAECENTCKDETIKHKDPEIHSEKKPCFQEREDGNCSSRVPRYYFNTQSNQCELFVYSGCNGNENNFKTYDLCENQCGSKIIPPSSRAKDPKCLLEYEQGVCGNTLLRYYYDDVDNVCKSFIFSGCFGNPNNFISKTACEKFCIASEKDADASEEEKDADASEEEKIADAAEEENAGDAGEEEEANANEDNKEEATADEDTKEKATADEYTKEEDIAEIDTKEEAEMSSSAEEDTKEEKHVETNPADNKDERVTEAGQNAETPKKLTHILTNMFWRKIPQQFFVPSDASINHKMFENQADDVGSHPLVLMY